MSSRELQGLGVSSDLEAMARSSGSGRALRHRAYPNGAGFVPPSSSSPAGQKRAASQDFVTPEGKKERMDSAVELPTAGLPPPDVNAVVKDLVVLSTPRSSPQQDRGSLAAVASALGIYRRLAKADPKLAPIGAPLVWAPGRQALCETVMYARNYQSSSYSSGGVMHSLTYDLASGPREREFMDGDVIISTAGGGLSKDKSDDSMTREHDQSETSSIQSLRNSVMFQNPVIIIGGNRNEVCPSMLPHAYNVLGWFKPTHVWSEKIKGKRVFRFRFERIGGQEEGWWAPKGIVNPAPLGSLPPPVVRACTECQMPSPQIYLDGWMCLNDATDPCGQFWMLNGNPAGADLTFDPRFLKKRTTWDTDGEPHSVAPARMPTELGRIQGQGVSWEAWRGLVCPECGCCTSRTQWLEWSCSNTACGFNLDLPSTPIPVAALRDLQHPISDGFAFNRDVFPPKSSGMELQVRNIDGYRTNVFTLPGIKGCIVHLMANATKNAAPNGPDQMWEHLQTVDIGLRRRALNNAILRGGSLTNHFAMNFGVQYNYVASVDTIDIQNADPVIGHSLCMLDNVSRQITAELAPGMHAAFNEVLALGYFEGQMIKYHDDGETGLGPVIATLSLGYPANMTIRMKAKYYNGVSKNGNYVDAAPLPGCRDYDTRKAAHEQLNAIFDPAQRKARMAQLPRELGLKKTGNGPDSIYMHLGHGDIVVMAGEEVQKYFEHQVKPMGKLRFALTCRYIDPTSVVKPHKH